ncbi:hypothetical protein ACSBR2_010662 [Camellia fascicularis]|uniref:Early nodulin-like protein 1 n=1 Tax=Camellia lanceoleosa TaxID=1840588 RepID=A0ACC0ISZ2_9ERIC|nr:Early nodulin-like protein 1 [Camellia lanceoleosa]
MASESMMIMSSTTLTLLLLLSCSHLLSVASFQFEVGDNQGWVVPPANDSKIYNDWASENRFQIGDTVHFKYKKDSVMEVSESEYKNCNSTHPTFFSNTGTTVYKLDRPGLFYFISGSAGHCRRGQRMIIKVLSHEDAQSGGSGGGSSSASTAVAVLSYGGLIAQFAFLSYIF